MSRINHLLTNYQRHIELPWQLGLSAQQRVIFCVYPQETERRLRANIGEFELVTKNADHEWRHFDLSSIFPEWLTAEDYKEEYFKEPELLENISHNLPNLVKERLETNNIATPFGSNEVIALSGIGTLFGFVKIKQVLESIAPLVPGRLVVFFPGSYDNDNYRLLDAHDGWGYLAVPITSSQ